jgi:hypothetical protein
LPACRGSCCLQGQNRVWHSMIPVVSALLIFCYAVYYVQGQAIM